MLPPPSSHLWQRLVPRFARTSLGAALFARVAHRLDVPIFRLSRGHATLTSLLTGLPIVMLTTTGAKSGQLRHTPLVAIPDADRIVLIASNFGRAHHPAWYHNLRAHPQVTVTSRGQKRRYHAHEAVDAERRRLWQQAVALNQGYEFYRQRAHNRTIPVIVLEAHDSRHA